MHFCLLGYFDHVTELFPLKISETSENIKTLISLPKCFLINSDVFNSDESEDKNSAIDVTCLKRVRKKKLPNFLCSRET